MFAGALQISSLELKCRCKWTGKFGKLKIHLQSCKYALLTCTNNCHSKILRKNFRRHLTKKCPRRQYQCPHCGETGEYWRRKTSHLKACPKVKVPVPKARSQVNIPVYRDPYMCTSPLLDLFSKYTSSSYEVVFPGKERTPRAYQSRKYEKGDQIHGHRQLTTQAEQALSTSLPISDSEQTGDLKVGVQAPAFKETQDRSETHHCLQIQTQAVDQKLQVNEQSDTIPATSSTPSIKVVAPFRFKLTNFQKCKDKDEEFHSLPFYTSQNGYKMCLEIHPNGNGEYWPKHTHISVFACLMKGDNDDSLTWPFTGKVTFELLNQLEDENHHSMTARFVNCETIGDRVTHDGVGTGGGIGGFISHTDLDYQPDKNRQYLKDDQLIFRVSVQAPQEECGCLGVTKKSVFQ